MDLALYKINIIIIIIIIITFILVVSCEADNYMDSWSLVKLA